MSSKDTGICPIQLKDLIEDVRKGIKSETDAQMTYPACVTVTLGAKVNMQWETERTL